MPFFSQVFSKRYTGHLQERKHSNVRDKERNIMETARDRERKARRQRELEKEEREGWVTVGHRLTETYLVRKRRLRVAYVGYP